MEQPCHALSDIDKCAKVLQGFDGSFCDGAWLHEGNVCPAFLLTFLMEDVLCGEDKMIAIFIRCDDPDIDLFPDPSRKIVIGHIAQAELGCRDKCADAVQVGDRASLCHAGDLHADILLRSQKTSGAVPGRQTGCLFQRKADMTMIIPPDDRRLKFLTDADVLADGIRGIVADILLPDDAVRIGGNVNRDLVILHADNLAVQCIAFADRAEGSIQLRFHIGHGLRLVSLRLRCLRTGFFAHSLLFIRLRL